MMKAAAPLIRCDWPREDADYIRYHDEEWGVPNTSDRAIFEKLVLEGFQAGLSWITILRKREHFRDVFNDFDPEKIVLYNDKKIAALMADPGIVRNRLKIGGTIDNAKAYLKLAETGSLSRLIWELAGGKPLQNAFTVQKQLPAETPTSKAISKELKARGFRFVGPTTVYAFMQSMGMVNDHLVACHRHAVCANLATAFKLPEGKVP